MMHLWMGMRARVKNTEVPIAHVESIQTPIPIMHHWDQHLGNKYTITITVRIYRLAMCWNRNN
jgi:hypothetical protein